MIATTAGTRRGRPPRVSYAPPDLIRSDGGLCETIVRCLECWSGTRWSQPLSRPHGTAKRARAARRRPKPGIRRSRPHRNQPRSPRPAAGARGMPPRRHAHRHQARPPRALSPGPTRHRGRARRRRRQALHRRPGLQPHRPRRTTALQRPRDGRRVRSRPHPRTYPRRHGRRAPTAASAAVNPDSPQPNKATSSTCTPPAPHHRRTRRTLRHRPRHRLPRDRPLQTHHLATYPRQRDRQLPPPEPRQLAIKSQEVVARPPGLGKRRRLPCRDRLHSDSGERSSVAELAR